MTIVRTRTPSGEAIVILPEAEFERLVALAEDTTDARTLQVSQARLANGTEEVLSESDLDALRKAPSALAFWRERRGLTTVTLAKLSGISEPVLSALDRGERTDEVIVYGTLAQVLGVDTEDLIPDDAST